MTSRKDEGTWSQNMLHRYLWQSKKASVKEAQQETKDDFHTIIAFA